jgi:hypothetical protein
MCVQATAAAAMPQLGRGWRGGCRVKSICGRGVVCYCRELLRLCFWVLWEAALRLGLQHSCVTVVVEGGWLAHVCLWQVVAVPGLLLAFTANVLRHGSCCSCFIWHQCCTLYRCWVWLVATQCYHCASQGACSSSIRLRCILTGVSCGCVGMQCTGCIAAAAAAAGV